MSVLALLGALAIVMAIWLATGGSHYEEKSLYGIGLFGLFICGAIFASTSFNMLNTKDTGIYWISFPASHIEKLLVTLFFNVIVFTVVYTICFFLLKFLAESYVHYLISNARYPDQYSYNKVNWHQANGFGAYAPNFLYAFFILQAAFVLGSASFKRFSFIITLIIIAAMLFLTIFYLVKLSKAIIPQGYDYQVVEVWSNNVNGIHKQYEMNNFLKGFIEVFLKYLLAPFLWFITLYKLREKEI
ncbi:MAG: hypothetical protein QM727_11490 [Niabella sp.]